MVRNNTLADAMKAIMNAERASKRQVLIRPATKLVIRFLRVMQRSGYIGDFEHVDDRKRGKIIINLLGRINKCAAISPRFPVRINEIDQRESNLLPARQFGHVVLTTDRGVIDHRDAKKRNCGGNILGFFF